MACRTDARGAAGGGTRCLAGVGPWIESHRRGATEWVVVAARLVKGDSFGSPAPRHRHGRSRPRAVSQSSQAGRLRSRPPANAGPGHGPWRHRPGQRKAGLCTSRCPPEFFTLCCARTGILIPPYRTPDQPDPPRYHEKLISDVDVRDFPVSIVVLRHR